MLDMNTNIINYMDKASKQLPEEMDVPKPTRICPDFSVPGYNRGIMFNSKSSNMIPVTTCNPVPTCALSFKPHSRPIQVRSGFSLPGYRMFNSKGSGNHFNLIIII